MPRHHPNIMWVGFLRAPDDTTEMNYSTCYPHTGGSIMFYNLT